MNRLTIAASEKNMLKGAIFVVLAIVLTFVFMPLTSQTALADTFNDFEYTVNPDGTTATITGYTGTGGNIEIPEMIGDKTINSIGSDLFTAAAVTSVSIPKSVLTIDSGAFWECRSLLSIGVDAENPNFKSEGDILFSKDGTVLVHYPAAKAGTVYAVPDTVTAIGDSAFDHNQYLQSITLTDNVTQIGSCSFWRCDALAGFTIPQSVNAIGDSPFANCGLVTDIAVETGNPAFQSIDGVLFDIGGTSLIQCPAGKTGSYTVPAGVTSIKSGAFRGCTQLKSISLCDDVTDIEDCAFAYCDGLTSVDLGSGVQKLGYGAFQSCSGLQSVMLPASVTSLDNNVFDGCGALRDAYFKGSAPTVGTDVFSNCADGLTVYHTDIATGFSNPWNGYATAVFDPDVTHTVSYDLNGAEGTAPDSQTVYEGVKLVCPADPTNGERNFGGWYTEATCENEWDFGAAVNSDLTLFAKWNDFIGSGTEADPYQVSTPEQLNAVRNYPDAHFIMTNDIDMTEATSEGGICWNDGAGWEPIEEFKGTFDGGGYVISGLFIERSGNPAAFINKLEKTSTLKNIGIINGSMYGLYAAGLASENSGIIYNSYNTCEISVYNPNSRGGGIAAINLGVIKRCYNTGKIDGLYSSSSVGGITGLNHYVICDSYNSGSVSTESDDQIGGIAGIEYSGVSDNWRPLITNCYNVGNLTAASPGGLVGEMQRGTIANSYFLNSANKAHGTSYTEMIIENTEKLSSSQMQLKETFKSFDFQYTWIMPTEGDYLYPILRPHIDIPTSGLSDSFAGGIGTKDNPYQISTAEQLNAVRDYRFSSFILINDIDLSSSVAEDAEYYDGGKGWNPIGDAAYPFEGNFDGNGHMIKGINIFRYNPYALGLFGVINHAKISNLSVEVYIYGENILIGGITGMALNSSITGCHVSGLIQSKLDFCIIGGIAGSSDGKIEYCYNETQIKISGEYCKVGGIVGINNGGIVQTSYNKGQMTFPIELSYVAGIVSYNKGTITDCYNASEINASSIVFRNLGSTNKCYSSAKASYFSYTPTGVFSNCFYLDSPLNKQKATSGITQKSDAQMQQMATFEGYDFSGVWSIGMNALYPYPELLNNTHDAGTDPPPSPFSGGDGSETSPYLVSTPQGLNEIRNYPNDHFLMTKDIDMTEETTQGGVFYNKGKGWMPIYEFYGTFDGGGYCIFGLNFDTYDYPSNCAFIDILQSSGFLKRLTISESTICAPYAAAFVSQNCGQISECINLSQIEGESAAGGITYRNMGQISKCINLGSITLKNRGVAGGISSYTSGSISDCYNAGSITALDGSKGCIVGTMEKTTRDSVINNCYNVGEIIGPSNYSGGIAYSVLSGCTISNCYYLDNLSNLVGIDSSYTGSNNLRLAYDQMIQQPTYSTFDFVNTWEIINGYRLPTLKDLEFIYTSDVDFDRNTLRLIPGEISKLNVSFTPSNATNKNVMYTTSNSSVVTVNEGTITAIGYGRADITVTTQDGRFTATCNVTVDQPLTGVTIDKHILSMRNGNSSTLHASFTPPDATNKNVTWSSSNDAIATVDQSGQVTAVSKGKADITVTTEDGGYTDTCTATVIQPVSKVKLSCTSGSIPSSVTAGRTLSLTATVSPSDATYKTVTWSSNNTSVATVDQSGNVTAVAPGRATIKATADGASDSCTLTVIPSQVTVTVSVNNASYGSVSGGGTYNIGDYVVLTASANPCYRFDRWLQNGTEISRDANYSFTAQNDASFTAEFAALPPVHISFTKKDVTAYGGSDGSISLSGSGGTSGAYQFSINGGTSWGGGNFGGLSAGSYTALVRDTNYPGLTASCTVSISQPAYIGSVPANKIASKASVSTAVTVIPPAAPRGYTTVSVTYSSSNPSVATVDANGNVTFLAGGKATIITKIVSQTVDKKGRVKTKVTSVKKAITVIQPVQSISLNTANVTVARAQKVKLTASFNPATATNKKVKWISSNPKVAVVSGAGVVTGKAGGTAVITCRAQDGSNVSASCTVTVTPIYPAGVKLSKASLTVKLGKTAALKAIIAPKNTDFKTVSWSSSNPAVVSVDAKGKIKAVSPGSAAITAVTSNGLSASCTVTVP